jgi:Cu-processing system ATP-binding protein
MTTIRAEGLCKSFDRLKVLANINFHIQPASVTAILGPNASGKSTLIKSILGLARPDAGQIYIDDKPIRHSWEYRRRIGYMPQIARFPENLKVRELLRMVMDIRGVSEPGDGELITAFGLDALMDRPLRVLSGGTRQKINAALAFMFCPDILVLDEPTAGLDPISITLLKEKIEDEKSAGKTVIMTSHNMHEVDEMADHILFLLDGTTCFDGSLLALKENTSKLKLEHAIVTLMKDGE